jgi:hypothetical protein
MPTPNNKPQSGNAVNRRPTKVIFIRPRNVLLRLQPQRFPRMGRTLQSPAKYLTQLHGSIRLPRNDAGFTNAP